MAEACGLFIALLAVAPVGAARQTASRAKPHSPALEFPTHLTVDGTFAHYLASPDGDIDGVVLENGTVARFAPRHRALDTLWLRKGGPLINQREGKK